MTKPAIHQTIRHRVYSWRKAEQGQSMVEFSFILIPFLLITIGTIEVGRAWSVKQAITNAAREGARILLLPYGVNQTCADVDCSSAESVQEAARTAIRTFLSNAGVNPDEPVTEIKLIRQRLNNGTITTEPLSGAMDPGNLIGVQVRHQHSSLIQGFFDNDSATINLVGVSVLRHE